MASRSTTTATPTTPDAGDRTAEPTSEDAVDAVSDYYAAINARRFRHAPMRLWSDGGRASGQTPQQFADGFADTTGMSSSRSMRLGASKARRDRATSKCRWRSKRSSATAACGGSSARTCCVARSSMARARSNGMADRFGRPARSRRSEARARCRSRWRVASRLVQWRSGARDSRKPVPDTGARRTAATSHRLAPCVAASVGCATTPAATRTLLPASFRADNTLAACKRGTARPTCRVDDIPGRRGRRNARRSLFPDDPARRAYLYFHDGKQLQAPGAGAIVDRESRGNSATACASA